MQLNSTDPSHFPNLKRVKQITSYHCAPAVLKMLLNYQGVKVKQNQIVDAAGIGGKIKHFGMTVAELGIAAKNLAPDHQFWHKDNASIYDLDQLINLHQLPVGIEWQGVFLPEDDDEDDGHYSVATHVDLALNQIILFDPYYQTDRIFALNYFETRWWDTNHVYDPVLNDKRLVKDNHMLFIVTPKAATFPQSLGMLT